MTQYDPWRGSDATLYAPTRPEPTPGQPYAVSLATEGTDPWAPTTPLPAFAPAQQTQPYPVGDDDPPTVTYEQYPATLVLPAPTGPAQRQAPAPTGPAQRQAPAPAWPVPNPASPTPAYPSPSPGFSPPPPAFQFAQPIGWYPLPHGRPMAPPKSAGIAYLLWFLLGVFGVHHFYLGRTGWGIAYLLSTVLLGWLGIGLFLVMIGCVVDLFAIPSYTRDANRRLTGYPY